MTRWMPFALLLLLTSCPPTEPPIPPDDDDDATGDDDDAAGDDDDATSDDDDATSDDDDSGADDDDDDATGDDDDAVPDEVLSDLEGFWRLEELSQVVGSDTVTGSRTPAPTTVGDDTFDLFVRGYLDIAAATDLEGTFTYSFAPIGDNLPLANTWSEGDVELEWADDKLVFDVPDVGVFVWTYEVDGDDATLTYDAEDPRNPDEYLGPHELVLARMDVPSSDVAGDWTIDSLTFGKLTVPAACTQTDKGVWTQIVSALDLDARGSLAFTYTSTTHAQDDCADVPSEQEDSTGRGHWDYEVASTTMTLWEIVISDGGETTPIGASYDVDLFGSTMTLTLIEAYGESASPDQLQLSTGG